MCRAGLRGFLRGFFLHVVSIHHGVLFPVEILVCIEKTLLRTRLGG